ncbi:glycoside hydrolase superfamily [Syncephalis plumigaleata]|nr:glycoside hydrolase superfamily [Syncephalis plumigaleata]
MIFASSFKVAALLLISSVLVVAQEPIRGVNLGGWLVIEPWITPSLFEQFESGPLESQTEDEWSFCTRLGRKEAERQLKHHWRTWVTEDDFRRLADAGINHVRIPVGYWAVEKQRHEPWVQGQLKYLTRGINWADQYGIRVIIDLHGVPGSQNGFDNSGKKGVAAWTSNMNNVHRSIRVLRQLAREFSTNTYSNVVGIELVNEPAHWSLDMNVVRNFYDESIGSLRELMGGEQSIVVADAFLPIHQWNDFMNKHNNDNLMLDTHHYQVFMDDLLGMDKDGHANTVCAKRKELQAAAEHYPVIVGEWSLATNDCAKWLNGFKVGARWDGTFPARNGRPIHENGTCDGHNDVSSFTPEYRAWLRRFAELQMDAYEAGRGWFFWNFKTEESPQWDYLLGVEEGWIPRNPAKRHHHC